MPVRIRLQRFGKKGHPFYHIVVADGRAPRDGKFIEKLGTYNPMTNPATIELNSDRACEWLKIGAQPSDTARSLLSRKGVMMKRHLQIGVEKGAITQEQADAKLNAWLNEKESKLKQKADAAALKIKEADKQRLVAETKIKEARAAALAEKRAAEEAAKKAEAEAAQATENVEVAETETQEETPTQEA